MPYTEIVLDHDGPVATITLNRPEVLNAISVTLRSELLHALRELNAGDEVRVVRLRGAGRGFCSGYDLSPGAQPYAVAGPTTPARGEAMADQGESRIARDRERLRATISDWLWMWGYRKPIVAQVHGYCLSGGLDLIGASDIVLAARSARFGHPAARGLGIPVTLGMLPARIGAAATKDLLFTGDLIDAEEAQALGLVLRTYADEEIEVAGMAYCQRIALNSMDALTVHKHVTNRWLELAGLPLAAQQGAEFDAILHESPGLRRFDQLSDDEGLKAALQWRDALYAPPGETSRPEVLDG